MTKIYDEKMPSYLAMSRGDLIAEILEHGGPVNDHLAAQEPQSMFSDEPEPEVPEAIKRSEEIVRVANMSAPSYFRLPTDGADQPIMLWAKDGDFIVQIGRERPWLNHKDPTRFAMIVTDLLWMCKPVTKAEWNWAMENGTWQTTK